MKISKRRRIDRVALAARPTRLTYIAFDNAERCEDNEDERVERNRKHVP